MLQIDTSDSIIINGRDTGLKLTQRRDETVVYSPEKSGQAYREHAMPHTRYSTAHDNPRPLHKTTELAEKFKTAGRSQLEADICSLLARL